MTRLFPLFLIIVCLFPATLASAQDMDAGVDAGEAMSHDPLAECMSECGARNEMCISTAEVADCLNNIPVCAGLAPHTREITQAFCEACGRATTGCESTSDPTHAPAVAAVVTPPDTEPEPEHHGSGRTPPTTDTRTEPERICARQRGIWMGDAEVAMPDGTVRHGLCRTPEGADLLRRIEAESRARTEGDQALGRRIDEEAQIRSDEDTELEDSIAHVDSESRRRDLEQTATIARLEEIIRQHMLHHGEALDWHSDPVTPATTSEHSEHSEHTRAPSEHPSFGQRGFARVRLQGFFWMGFRTFHPVLNQRGRSEFETLPVGLGLDATLVLALERGWYAEAGAGIAYDWPDFAPYALNLGSYFHGGLRYYLVPAVSIGGGVTLMQRYRPNLESTYTQLGGYVDVSFHIRFTPDVTDPSLVITVRGSAAAAFRPGIDIAPDGTLVLEIGPEF